MAMAMVIIVGVLWYDPILDTSFRPNNHPLYLQGPCHTPAEVEVIRAKAQSGDPVAQMELGVIYGKGVGLPKDEVEEIKWMQKAAEQDHAGAQYRLGLRYERAEGVNFDPNEALKWYLKAANQGLAKAQTSIARIYLRGSGILKDEVEAYKWFLLGDDFYPDSVPPYFEPVAPGYGGKTFEQRLKPEQLAEGQKRAREFREQLARKRHHK